MSKYLFAAFSFSILLPVMAFAQASPPVITAVSLPDTSYGASVSHQVTASGGVTPYTWSAIGLPDGVSIDPATGVISGIPVVSLGVVGSGTSTYTPMIHIQDAIGQVADAQLIWDIVGSFSYSRTPAGSGLIANPITFHLKGIYGVDFCTPDQYGYGSQPLVDVNNSVTGRATLSFPDHNPGDHVDDTYTFEGVGSYTSIKLRCGSTLNQHFFEGNDTNSIIFTIASVPTITTNPLLQPAAVGVLYSATLQYSLSTNIFHQSYPAAPYTWSVIGGTLPGGLSIDSSTGVISGTPTSEATSTFTIQVQDALGQSSVVDFTMTAFIPPLTLTATADSFLRNGQTNRNEGANPHLFVQSSGQNRTVLAFSPSAISDFIAAHGVSAAKLVLTIASNGNNWGTTGRTIEAHPLSQLFTEGNGQDAGLPNNQSTRGTGSGTTWSCATDTAIDDANVDCNPKWNGGAFGNATASAQTVVNNQTGEMQWDVTQDVLAGNSGWLMKKTNEGLNGTVEYYSREGAVAAGNATYTARLVLTP